MTPLPHCSGEDASDRREEAARPAPLFVIISPLSFSYALVLRRGRKFIHLDMHDLISREVTQDHGPCHPGHPHVVVRTSHKQVDPIALDLTQLRPELDYHIDCLLQFRQIARTYHTRE